MKLNYRQTVLVGLAFFSICAFWQMYDSVIPLMLNNTFHLDETLSGFIMAGDNILALFLLPLFGALSDKTDTRIGRRMPFIIGGTAAAVLLMNLLPQLDNRYSQVPSLGTTVSFVVVLALLLICMGLYRSPAVALMPDVTPKPLRSKGNAVINLMGAIGGVVYLVLASTLYSKSRTEGLEHIDYSPLFLLISLIMACSVLVLFLTVKEKKLEKKREEYEAAHPEEALSHPNERGEEVLSKGVKKSLLFLLLSVALWFIGYNGITTWFTTYAASVWNMSLGEASNCLTVATAGAIVSYLPVGVFASKIGRKKTILCGTLLLAACFFTGFLFSLCFDSFHSVFLLVFALVGLAWAAINVNSLPMVVEMCKGSDIGKFTGYYYTFSMAAQIVTPIVAGWLLQNVGYKILFLYSSIFVFLSWITMLFVRHGDSIPKKRKGIEIFDEE